MTHVGDWRGGFISRKMGQVGVSFRNEIRHHAKCSGSHLDPSRKHT